MRVRDRDVMEPRVAVRQRAEATWTNQHSDQDEADDRADAYASKRRNDNAGGTEDDQRIAEPGCAEIILHTAFRAGGPGSVTPRRAWCVARDGGSNDGAAQCRGSGFLEIT